MPDIPHTPEEDEAFAELLERLGTKIAAGIVMEVKRALDDRPLYTVRALADRLALSERTVYEMLQREELPSFYVAGGQGGGKSTRRIDPVAVDAYLNARRAGGEKDAA